MGEIAEAMLEGDLCEGCGVYIDDDARGFPRYCSRECAEGRGVLFVAPDDQRGEPRPPGQGLSKKAIKRRRKREAAALAQANIEAALAAQTLEQTP